ncbi:MAG: YeeE/YedE family protein [Myxococcales bacterium]|nr:YeeE/YedE family protein [Myxococcales bacterium]
MKALLRGLVPLLSGLVFAVGLSLGGMTQPSKVVGFLDFAGDWDPSLLAVMFGAVAVYMPLQRLIVKRPFPVLETSFSIPTRRDLDARLLTGAAIFGVGWGLAGFCPGPGLASLGAASGTAFVFVVAMLAGMSVKHALDAAQSARKQALEALAAREPDPTV